MSRYLAALSELLAAEREGWCAKEAAGKARGRGLSEGPQALVVTHAKADTGAVTVAYHARDDTAGPAESLPVQTLSAEGLICAWCVRPDKRKTASAA